MLEHKQTSYMPSQNSKFANATVLKYATGSHGSRTVSIKIARRLRTSKFSSRKKHASEETSDSIV